MNAAITRQVGDGLGPYLGECRAGRPSARKTTFALMSWSPLKKIEAYRKRIGWTIRWHSSFGSDFNYDFHITLDEG